MAGPATSLLFATLVVLGFMLVLSTTHVLQSEGDDHQSWAELQQTEQVKVLGKGKSSVVHSKQDLDYMSKRRVPNGPDPIHNRRAGNSGRPPGQT